MLAHAYTDRARYASLGLSVAGAALTIGAALAVAVGLLLGDWAGWLSLPAGVVGAAIGLRRALQWVGAGPRFRRRASALAVGLVLLASILEWPLGLALFHSVEVESVTSPTALTALHWAIRGVLALLLLVPLYGLTAAQHGSYALAIAKRQELNVLLNK